MENTLSTGEAFDWQFYCNDISGYSEYWFFAREFKCGSLTKEQFKKILALSRASPICLKEISWKRNYFEIKLLDTYTKRQFIIAAMKYKANQQNIYEKYQYYILKNSFVILFKKDKLESNIKKILLNFLDNFSKINPPDLFGVVYSDNNELVSGSGCVPSYSDKNVSSRPEYYKWGNAKMGYTFMLNDALLEQRFGWLRFKENETHIRIKCGDIECYNRHHPFFISEIVPLTFNTYNTYSTFMENVFRYCDGKLKDNSELSLFQQIMFRKGIIEFGEEEVILGSDDKVVNILEEIVNFVKKQNISLSIVDTCINKIMGGDLCSFIAKIRKNNKSLKIVYEQHHNSPEEKKFIKKDYETLMMDVLRNKKISSINHKMINLIGFEDDYSTGELAEILGRFFNIKLNTILFPGVDLSSLKHFFKASLNVVNHFEFYKDTYNNVILNNFKKIKTIVSYPPYGIDYTIQWLKSITDFFGISIKENREWNDYLRQKILGWEELSRQAKKFRLGLIVSNEDVNSLLEPSKYIIGIPLLRCLEEMGFGLNILITGRENFDNQKMLLLNFLRDKEKHRIELLNNHVYLEKWIAEGDCNCIYSDFRDDMRIILNGRYTFSLFLLEKGFGGAMRTLKELLRFCRIACFNKYPYFKGRVHPIIIE